MRTIEATIPGDHAVVVSSETSDGGVPGQFSEVSRELAAKLVVQGKARLADEDEAEQFRSEVRAAKQVADELAMRARVQVNLLPETDLELLRSALRKQQ